MKLRLISIVLAGGLGSRMPGGTGFMNLAMVPAVRHRRPSALRPSVRPHELRLADRRSYESYNEVFAGNTVRNLQTTARCDPAAAQHGRDLRGPAACARRRLAHRVADRHAQLPEPHRAGHPDVLGTGVNSCSTGARRSARRPYGEGFDRDGGTLRFEVLDQP